MTPKEQAPNKWLVLAMMTLSQAGAIALPQTVMPVLFTSVTKEIDLTLAQIGMIWGALPLGLALFSLPCGLLGDRFGVRKVIGIGCFFVALTNAFRGMSGDFVTLAISMFLCGASIGAVLSNLPKLASLYFPPRQLGLALGILVAGFSIGGMLTTALSVTFVLPLVGVWRNVLFLYSTIPVILGIIWLSGIREARPSQATDDTDKTAMKVPFRKSLGVVLRVKQMWLLVIPNLGLAGTYIALMGYVPVYLENNGVLKSTGDAIASTIFAAGILGTITLPALSDRIGARKSVLIVCAGVMGICTYLLSISGAVFFWLLIPLIGFTFMGTAPLLFALPLEMKEIGPIYGASATGLVIASQNVGAFLLPAIGGNLAELNQSWPFVCWAIFVFVAIVCLFFVRETIRK